MSLKLLEIAGFSAHKPFLCRYYFDGTGGSNRVIFPVLIRFLRCFDLDVSFILVLLAAKNVANTKKNPTRGDGVS